jgi:hypothetical protein
MMYTSVREALTEIVRHRYVALQQETQRAAEESSAGVSCSSPVKLDPNYANLFSADPTHLCGPLRPQRLPVNEPVTSCSLPVNEPMTRSSR